MFKDATAETGHWMERHVTHHITVLIQNTAAFPFWMSIERAWAGPRGLNSFGLTEATDRSLNRGQAYAKLVRDRLLGLILSEHGPKIIWLDRVVSPFVMKGKYLAAAQVASNRAFWEVQFFGYLTHHQASRMTR